MPPSRLERYQGAMIGVLCGDALGAPYEMKKAGEIFQDLDSRGGLTLFDYTDPWGKKRKIPKGHPTDDSELSAALAQSFVSCNGFDPIDVYHSLRKFILLRRPILTEGEAFGTGGTLRDALSAGSYEESLKKFDRGEIRTTPSNGSLMRCISVPLFYHPQPDQLMKIADKQSVITHVNERPRAACVAYSKLIHYILYNHTPADAWYETKIKLKPLAPWLGFNSKALEEVAQISVSEPSESEIWPLPGAALTSLRVAVWAASTATSFADGITKSITVGGDTDTYAAITGGILGAYYGINGIPEEWSQCLIGKETMIKLGQQLYQASTQLDQC